jgi:hypothetical protein
MAWQDNPAITKMFRVILSKKLVIDRPCLRDREHVWILVKGVISVMDCGGSHSGLGRWSETILERNHPDHKNYNKITRGSSA